MDALYFALMPLINALNFSQTLVIPLLVSAAAVGWGVYSGRLNRLPVLWLDRLLLLLVGVALLSTAINALRLDARSVNHLVALIASLTFFYLGVERFSNRLSDAAILRALWWGYAACTGFAILEFVLTNFKGVSIGNMIPRPAVENYEPTFFDLLLVRARSTFEESGHFAAYMAICVPFLAHYHWKLRPSKAGQLLFVVLTVCAMLAAFSISAFLFLPAAALAVSATHSLRTLTIGRSTAVLLAMLLLALLLLASSEDLLYNVFLRKFQGASFADRSDKFTATLDLMSQASWLHVLFGFGPGSYASLGIKPAISVYLNALRDYGVLGMGMWLMIMAYAMASAVRINGPMGRAVLFGMVLTALYFIAIPNYFHPHYYLPLLFYKRAFLGFSGPPRGADPVTQQTVIFFNPYADPQVKGAARRIAYLRHLLDGQGVPNAAVLASDYDAGPRSLIESLALGLGLRRVAYFLHAWRLCRKAGCTVVSEVIFTPTWHPHMVLTVHDLKAYDTRATRGGLLRRGAYGVFTRLAARVVVVSESVRADLQRLCGVAADRIHVVPNGISRERLALGAAAMGQPPRYDFVYVSSFARHKRHDLLLRAAPTGSRLCLIGRDMGALAAVRAEAARRAGEVEIDILEDVQTDTQLFNLLGASRCGVFPSVFEGFGIPLLEYAAAGLYVVASDIAPFRELRAHVDCFVPTDDEAALRAALMDSLRRPCGPLRDAADKVANSPYTDGAISRQLMELLFPQSHAPLDSPSSKDSTT